MSVTAIYKWLACTIGGGIGWVLGVFEPTFPLMAVVFVLIVWDAWSAFQLDKRVHIKYPDKTKRERAKFTSFAFGKVITSTIPKRLMVILLAFCVERWVFIHVDWPLSYIAAGVICFEQAWSILENESSCREDNEGRFWAVLQKIMVDKTARHFDIDPAVLEGLTGRRPEHLGDGTGEPMNNGRQRPSTFMATTLKPKPVVILGTAHGSNVPGKCSPDGKFREYRFSREVITMLRPRLEAHGFTVFVDMPSDEVPRPQTTELSLRCRYVNGICKKFGKDNCIYVSIHVNAAGSDGQWHDARGFAVYVARSCSEASKRLAQTLCDLAISRGLRGNRAVPSAHYWQADFYVLRNTACPAVLTENLFQDNRTDVEFLSSQAGKEAVATLHLDAIKLHFAK